MERCWILVSNSEPNLNGPRCKAHGCQWSFTHHSSMRSSAMWYYGQFCLLMGSSQFIWSPLTIISFDQPNLLTVNHTDGDIGHLKHCVQIYPSARLLFIISISPTWRNSNSTGISWITQVYRHGTRLLNCCFFFVSKMRWNSHSSISNS